MKNRTCYYFDEMIKTEDSHFNNILLNEKSNKKVLTYDVLYKNLVDRNSLWITFKKMNAFIRDYSGTKYLVLFGFGKYSVIFNRTIRLKANILYDVSCNYSKIKIDSGDTFSLEKRMTKHIIIILIKSV